ncbi:MAG: metallophosphoesterase [Chloroflexota bacterium]
MSEKLVTFVHMSDTHIHIDPEHTGSHNHFSSREPVRKLIDTINNLEAEVDFILHTGDITDHPEAPTHYHIARDILQQLSLPVYYVPGNHDNVAMLQSAFLSRPDYGIAKHYDYQFVVNGVQFIMLDSHSDPAEQSARGYIAPEQLAWLDALLSTPDERPLVVALHHHTIPLEAPWLDNIVLTNGLDLHTVLLKAKDRLRGVFYGHIHESVVTVRGGISYYSVHSGWFQTRTWYGTTEPARDFIDNPGFNLVTLTETDTFVRSRRIALID